MNCEHSSTRIPVTVLITRHLASLCVIYFGNRKFARRPLRLVMRFLEAMRMLPQDERSPSKVICEA